MIISHRHKFIFVKNRKVAGTSVELALAKICGPDDILSSDVPETRRQVGNDKLSNHARNYEGSFNIARELILDARPSSVARILRDRFYRHRFYNHMRATSIQARIEPKIWNSYYKFTFERNSWDKMVSFYYWYYRNNKGKKNINDFICGKMIGSTLDQKYPTDWERYTMKNKVIVDDIFDYKDLNKNITVALHRAGVEPATISQISLSRANSNTRSTNPDALSQDSDNVIRRVFAKEIYYFGYTRPDRIELKS